MKSRALRVVAAAGAAAAVALAAAVGAYAAEPQWNIARIGAPQSADGMVIAVIDSGVDNLHPAFGGRVLGQIDYTGNPAPGDLAGHGTHVAGTAAGEDSICGPIGVAPDATILPIRFIGSDGSGLLSDAVRGIRYAADNGAHVINMSFGDSITIRNQLSGGGSSFRDAVEYAWSKGSIPVISAGNDELFGFLGSGYSDLSAVVVTATDADDELAPYATSVGNVKWGISAPGGDGSGEMGRDVLSAYPDAQCALAAGTSMAAPHVSGVLAVLRARGLSPQDAVDLMLRTAQPLGSVSVYGAGLVSLSRALAEIDQQTVTSTTVRPTTAVPTTTTTDPPPTTRVTNGATASPSSTTSTLPDDDRVGMTGGADDLTAATTGDAASDEDPSDDEGTGDSTVFAGTPLILTDENDGVGPLALVAGIFLAASASATAVGALRLRSRR